MKFNKEFFIFVADYLYESTVILHVMDKQVIIDRIKDLCNEKNDREIKMDISYNDRIFHARYLFLGNKLYITDMLVTIELKELDMGVLEKIGDVLKIYDN